MRTFGTKWNFLKFTPGLVGGHCIGVDPYYLTYKAEEIGYNPQVILAGRRINDGMGKHVAEMTIKKLIQADKAVKGARVLILGLTFKEDVPDIRNTKVVDIISELREYGVEVQVHDTIADPAESWREYGVELMSLDDAGHFDAVVLAVAHQDFKSLDADMLKQLACNGNACGVVIDVKSMFDRYDIEGQGMLYWGL